MAQHGTINWTRLLILAVLAFAVLKWGVPWWKKNQQPAVPANTTASSARGTYTPSCPDLAQKADFEWSDGISRFVNPPYDKDAWDRFHNDVDSRMAEARSACTCSSDECEAGRQAMEKLDTLLTGMDGAVRNGTPPPMDLPQRQEELDNLVAKANK